MSVIVRDHAGKVLHRSANLRGILDHARRVPVRKVRLLAGTDGTPVYSVEFDNGDSCRGTFADPGIMVDWFVRRRRSWSCRYEVAGSIWSAAWRSTRERAAKRWYCLFLSPVMVAFNI